MKNYKKQKTCPYCKNPIDAKAVLCVNCQRMLPKRNYNTLILIAAIIGVFFFWSILLTPLPEDEYITETPNTQTEQNNDVQNNIVEVEPEKESEKETEKKPEIEYIQVTVDEMISLLEENALKAEKKYQDVYVEVTGKLETIDSDGKYISLGCINDTFTFLDVQCYIKNDEQIDQVLEMKIDDTVTLKGKIISIGEVLGYSLNIDSIE